MAQPVTASSSSLLVSHVELYVTDARAAAEAFTGGYGFQVFATAERTGAEGASRSLALRQGGIVLMVTQALDATHPAAAYTAVHGDGIADIALTTADARAVFAEVAARGATLRDEPVEHPGGWVTARVAAGFDDVHHTLVQRPAAGSEVHGTPLPLPGFVPVAELAPQAAESPALTVLDHVAVTVRTGELASSTGYYERAFGYESVYEELMVQGEEAMDSKAVRSPAGDLTFTVLAPSPDHQAGHIGDFLARHGSGGVHHLAFATENIVETVARLDKRGIVFLSTPDTYYEALAARLDLSRHSVEELREPGILADEDHAGQLFQIFTRTVHPQRTLFYEIIERIGADTFGGGNVRALYEAVQAEKAEHEGDTRTENAQ
ncbi:4-hydroxyphenylpyruvate dioxygenase [Streptomyces venezuelae]|uniref:4-hydroxyphenylpyruvate dioxygenase n=1 Tax=Streptomyces gardneri TaxID=66892 RepID=UPI0006BD73D4|nr:4-hydroxyphenylpyruvate dioxygenase [Streptomyces gardneri]ALO13230.1 4-hydroxyphenylpyruvate dioxygenase [Streptomyces venezuelae]QPK49893.1 4-hydroxyphenylpyruvate dioxygenase [Streptomyces gardneri]WRK41459.1 4-hydroxyphenylpyruvate dioxygenase [Streptomyces venezuelae]CUM36084.1 4-hydroxyphenylpyruvate dioxygenase [Streptomyces venezuelae]